MRYFLVLLYSKDRIDFFREESLFEGEYLNVDDVIAFCHYLMNKMRWNLIIFPFVYF